MSASPISSSNSGQAPITTARAQADAPRAAEMRTEQNEAPDSERFEQQPAATGQLTQGRTIDLYA